MNPLLLVLAFLLSGCYTLQVPEEENWRLWPRRESAPLASADCLTDGCLDYREYVLANKFGEGE